MGLHHSYKHVQWNLSDETTQGRGKKAVFKYRWSFNEGLTYIKYTAMGNENEDPFNTGGLLKKV